MDRVGVCCGDTVNATRIGVLTLATIISPPHLRIRMSETGVRRASLEDAAYGFVRKRESATSKLSSSQGLSGCPLPAGSSSEHADSVAKVNEPESPLPSCGAVWLEFEREVSHGSFRLTDIDTPED